MINFSQHFNKRQKDENSTADGSDHALRPAPVHQKLLKEIGTCQDKGLLLKKVFESWIEEKNLNPYNK